MQIWLMLSPNRADHIALSKYAISSQLHVPTNLEKMAENPYVCRYWQKNILGLNLDVNGPNFRAWNFDKNKNYPLEVEDYLK